MMNLDSFIKMIQTFGTRSEHWETDQTDPAVLQTYCDRAADIMKTEKRLDDDLNLFQPPAYDKLVQHLYAAVINEKNKHVMFLFLRHSTWISLLLMIGGFYLGWYQTHQDYVNTESYFNALFDDLTY